MSRALRITVDHTLCVGNGQCVASAPRVFAHNDEVQSVVIDPAGAPEVAVIRGAVRCPTGAIRVEDAGTGALLFPQTEGAR